MLFATRTSQKNGRFLPPVPFPPAPPATRFEVEIQSSLSLSIYLSLSLVLSPILSSRPRLSKSARSPHPLPDVTRAVIFQPSSQLQWSLYSCSVSFFHFSEFFVTAVFKPDVVSYNCKSKPLNTYVVTRTVCCLLATSIQPARNSKRYVAVFFPKCVDAWFDHCCFLRITGS